MSTVREARTDLTWATPQSVHRGQVAAIVEVAGVFRPDEVEVALEVFDAFCDAPGKDYWAVAAFGESEELAGFALYGPTPCTVDTWDLYWIAVHPSSHGSGVGRGLMERVESHMRAEGARLCAIETSSRDEYSATRRFYVACGYAEVARIADFYDDGDARVTYTKRFTQSKQ